MKSKIATLLLALSASAGFAQDAVIPAIPVDMTMNSKTLKNESSSFTYFRLQTADQEVNQAPNMLPGVGLGYRYSINNATALDVSANYNGSASLDKSYFYTLPKASVYRYVSPKANSSFYYGAGLAFGGVKKAGALTVKKDVVVDVKKDAVAATNTPAIVAEKTTLASADSANFQGLIPSATIGVEMGRTETVRTFIELSVSQPTLRIDSLKNASFTNLPRPIGEFSIGIGY